jgi:MFS family permease
MSNVERPAPALKRRHILAVTLGNALEFYDFITYAFFAIPIGHAFFPSASDYGSLMLSLATFGAGFVTRPLGSIILGAYGDRAGRRPAMLLCFLLIGASTLAMALIPPYAAIGIAAPILAVIARMVQGFSLGGEVGASTSFLIEAAPPHRRGLAAACQTASQGVASLAGSLVGLAVTALLPAHLLDGYGWRIAFLLGASAVPFGLWMRARLPETLHAPEHEHETTAAAAAPYAGSSALPSADPPALTARARIALARRHWPVLALSLAVVAGGTTCTYIGSYAVTYAQSALGMPASAGFAAETCRAGVAVPAVMLGGYLSDRYGRRVVNVSVMTVALVLTYPVFSRIVTTRSELWFVAGMTALGVSSQAMCGSFYAALGESLPRAIRCTGFGAVYSLSVAIFGGTTQVVVTWLIHVTGSALAPAWLRLGATALMLVALTLLPETAPTRLARRRSVKVRAAAAGA